MRILFLTPEPPYPPHGGGRILTCHAIRALAQRHEVAVLSLYHHDPAPELTPLGAPTTLVRARGKWHLPSMLRACVDPARPYKALRFGPSALRERLRALLAAARYDVIHLQTFYPAEALRGLETPPVVHYAENAEGRLLAQLAQHTRNPLLRLAARLEARRVTAYERELGRRCARTLAISPQDRARLVEDGHDPAKTFVLPPYIDTEALAPQPARDGDPRCEFVFVGRMSYYPNADAALWLGREIMPRVWRRLPAARLAIVGQGPPRAVRALAHDPRVTVTGWVADAASYVRGADVCLAPLRLGGGVRLKILEAAAQGKAMVATPLAAEGLLLTHDAAIALAADADTFADAACALLHDAARREQLGRCARHAVVQHYDYRRVVPQLEEHYRAAVFGPCD